MIIKNMATKIKCPNCGQEVEISEALTEHLRGELKVQMEEAIKQSEEKARQKFAEEMELRLKNQANELTEQKERNQKLTEQLLELNKTLRQLKEKDDSRELEMQKQLLAEKEKIKEEVNKQTGEEFRLRDLEKEKKIKDMEKLVEELKRKAQQGSQQTQGEVLELDIEQELKSQFPNDQIEEVRKGTRGADVIQIVKTPMGNIAGKILWEVKRTKNWEDKWVDKLKADQRLEGAELAGIITQTMPKDFDKDIINIKKVWVCIPRHFINLVALLREQLLAVARQKAVSAQSSGAAQELFDYITSHQFNHQLEAIIESYLGMQEQVIKERMAFEKQWKHREMQLEKMYKSLFNIYGGITGAAGSSLPPVKNLELLEEGDDEKKKKENQAGQLPLA
ncbi:MAG: hypothetical protein CEN88_196 [Candidatus Berkelbacteria bacterium Licking1014_2]|uniref:DUF2130 domain-containing protein n=1 Tax=Candidatus Berkelbacteria bacterium Licking1014_2 TaxID=2017146 RepID=A0A554LW45_9BACT|nr:MAG: hypothetical protein CEN88_196 [Candidatus Berkelbacteria bacterium Licking1014_2]